MRQHLAQALEWNAGRRGEGDDLPIGVDTRIGAPRGRCPRRVPERLRKRGLERTPGDGEVRVAALLVARRSVMALRRATAMQTLPSFHEQGNFEIEADVTDLRAVDRLRLAVFVTGPHQEKLIWQGELNDQFLDGFTPHLDDALDSLLADFPPRASAAAVLGQGLAHLLLALPGAALFLIVLPRLYGFSATAHLGDLLAMLPSALIGVAMLSTVGGS